MPFPRGDAAKESRVLKTLGFGTAPFLEVSEERLDGVWRDLGQWELSLAVPGAWNGTILKVLSNLNLSMVL